MPIDYVPRLARDGRRLLDVARAHGPSTPIPTCPGMTIGEMVRHLGAVYGLVLLWTREGQRPEHWDRQPPDKQNLHEWTGRLFTELVHELGQHAPDEPCSSWSPADQTYRFWARRMAAETLIHRYDVENAVLTAATNLDPSLAADGVDEVMTLWLPMKTAADEFRPTARVKITCGSASWVTEVDRDGGAVLDPRGASYDAEISGDPTALDLWLWGRVGNSSVRIDGSAESVEVFRSALATATG